MMVKRFLSVADHVLGHSVHDVVNENIGTIKDVFIDADSNRPIFVVLATGGFLGIGSDHIVLPWHTLEFNTNSHDIKLTIDRHALKNAPDLDIEKLSNADSEEADKMFGYYGKADFEKVKNTNESDTHAEEPSDHAHEGYEGSADITDQEPKHRK